MARTGAILGVILGVKISHVTPSPTQTSQRPRCDAEELARSGVLPVSMRETARMPIQGYAQGGAHSGPLLLRHHHRGVFVIGTIFAWSSPSTVDLAFRNPTPIVSSHLDNLITSLRCT